MLEHRYLRQKNSKVPVECTLLSINYRTQLLPNNSWRSTFWQRLLLLKVLLLLDCLYCIHRSLRFPSRLWNHQTDAPRSNSYTSFRGLMCSTVLLAPLKSQKEDFDSKFGSQRIWTIRALRCIYKLKPCNKIHQSDYRCLRRSWWHRPAFLSYLGFRRHSQVLLRLLMKLPIELRQKGWRKELCRYCRLKMVIW